MQRINWIDWVKAWCMTVVVFDHTPHDGSPFLLQFLAATNLSSFFFISGYLKKPTISQSEALKKYTYCLIIPYLIYNAVYYPYWLSKTYIDQGGMPSFSLCLKPIIGTFLGQLNSGFSCELNGVTWFLLSLFLMHWVTDICNKKRNKKTIMLMISIIAIILYGANKYYHFAPYLTFHGFVRCVCFFFLGNVIRQTGYLKDTHLKNDFAIGLSSLVLSLAIFYWHINEELFVLHIILYYIVNLFSVFSIIFLFRCISKFKSRLVLYVSLGTMIIFGLHRILLGCINFGMERFFHQNDITYEWYTSLFLALAINLILLPLIIYAKNHFPILLGKKV